MHKPALKLVGGTAVEPPRSELLLLRHQSRQMPACDFNVWPDIDQTRPFLTNSELQEKIGLPARIARCALSLEPSELPSLRGIMEEEGGLYHIRDSYAFCCDVANMLYLARWRLAMTVRRRS